MRRTLVSDTRTYKTYVYEDGSVTKVDVWGNESARSTFINKDGYVEVTIKIGNKHRRRLLHRLIAQAWIPNPENKRTVNHKDGNKLNNHVDNLEWATDQENLEHARLVLGVGSKWIPIIKASVSGEVLNTYDSVKQAERDNRGLRVYGSYRGEWIRGGYVFIPEDELSEKGMQECLKRRKRRERRISKNVGKRKYTPKDVIMYLSMWENFDGTLREFEHHSGLCRKTFRYFLRGTYFT